MAIIKQIEVNNVTYDIDAKYWDGHTFDDTIKLKFVVVWTEVQWNAATEPSDSVKATIPAVPFHYNRGAGTTTGAMTAASADKSTVYLIYDKNLSGQDNYDEYMVITEGGGTPRWERIGGTGAIDLSNYVKKGTYTTGESSAANTGQTGDDSCTTSSGGSGTGTVSGTLSLSGNTGNAGAHTFTINLGATNFSASGKVDIPAHTHSITPTTATVEVTNVSGTTSESAHTHTVTTHEHAAGVTVIKSLNPGSVTGINFASPSDKFTPYVFSGTNNTTNNDIMRSPTVTSDGILKWSLATPIVLPITATTVVSGVGETATVAGAVSAKTLTTSAGSAHSHGVSKTTQTITYVSGITQTGIGGAASSQTVTITLAGSQSFSFASHSHAVTLSTTAFTQMAVAIPAHTHRYSQVPKHRHSMSHTHNISLTVDPS